MAVRFLKLVLRSHFFTVKVPDFELLPLDDGGEATTLHDLLAQVSCLPYSKLPR